MISGKKAFLLCLCSFGIICCITSKEVAAATLNWTGGTSANWSNQNNWNPAQVPANGDDLVFNSDVIVGNHSTTNDLAANTQFNSISITNNTTNSIVLKGNQIDLGVGGIIINGTSPNNMSLELLIRLTSAQTWSSTGGVNSGSGFAINTNGFQLSLNCQFGFTMNGPVTGSGGLTILGGSISPNGNNTYSGPTIVDAQIQAYTGTAIGDTSAVTVDGTISFVFASTETIGSLSGTGLIQNIPIFGPTVLTTGGDNTSTTFSGIVAGRMGITKMGTETLILSGNNTYTEATTISAGTLQIDGSATASTFTVQNGGTLTGSGSVGATSINSGGALAPGASTGILSSGNLTLVSGADFNVELNGTTAGSQYDQLDVTGTVDVSGATLNIAIGCLAVGNTFTIINNDRADAIVGTFAGLSEGGSVTVGPADFQITYVGGDGNDIVLTVTAFTPAEIDVLGNSVSIPDGNAAPSSTDDTDFGLVDVNGGSIDKTFTITNSGVGTLNITLPLTFSGTNAVDFSVTADPATAVIPGGSTTFTVHFDPSATGIRSATLSIANDDCDEKPYDFAIQGNGFIVTNQPPAISSFTSDLASPAVGQSVTFITAASDPDNDPLTIHVDFGDGTTGSGSNASHAYTVVGIFTVTVTVSDGNGGMASASLMVTVGPADSIAGVGSDTDGDGFSDTLEAFLGTDPISAISTPFAGQPTGTPEIPVIRRLKVIMNFKKTGKDRIFLVGAVPLPDGFDFNGQEVVIDVGGVQKQFTLQPNGIGTDGTNRIRFFRPKSGLALFRLARNFKGDFRSTLLASSNLDNANVAGEARSVHVTILINNTTHVNDVRLVYSARQGKKGVAK